MIFSSFPIVCLLLPNLIDLIDPDWLKWLWIRIRSPMWTNNACRAINLLGDIYTWNTNREYFPPAMILNLISVQTLSVVQIYPRIIRECKRCLIWAVGSFPFSHTFTAADLNRIDKLERKADPSFLQRIDSQSTEGCQFKPLHCKGLCCAILK